MRAWEENCILLPRAHFLIVRAQIENNRSYVRIVYMLYWRSALTVNNQGFFDLVKEGWWVLALQLFLFLQRYLLYIVGHFKRQKFVL